MGVVRSRQQGRPWPWSRLVLWCAGIAAATISVAGPLAAASHASFVAHMWAHLLIGMLAPLLLVLAAPISLAMRALSVEPARRLSRVLRSRPLRVLSHPVTAAGLSAGGLWLLYSTPLLQWMQSSSLVHVVVHAHLLLAGYLLTAAAIGLDPSPHRAPRPVTAVALLATMASHSILAKVLYADPPGLYTVAEVQAGAQLMYYAGSWIEVVIVALFCARWYREAGRRVPGTATGRAGAAGLRRQRCRADRASGRRAR
ncbi:cytochrome c oxidase assembly protein [Agrococcus sp. ProA11]|uniref:cytochrome c oxidase assembly protein n=1 Tax=Agrococcus chionoecetis TaxID=3153752 RepID=UPI003260DEB6